MSKSMNLCRHAFALIAGALLLLLSISNAQAAPQNLGDVANNLTLSFSYVSKFITSLGFILGLGFYVASIMKFKQHKDNPTQIPIGTPIALMFIATALAFMPSLLDVIGGTLFGPDNGLTGGPSGVVFLAAGNTP